jgi:outer membrane protein assembly factor BamB
VLAPTIVDGIAYTNGGYYGGGVYAFDADDGMALWSRFSGDDDMTTPAVADGHAYFYDGGALRIYDAFDGSVVGNISDPYDPEWGYSHHGAPMLGSPDHVFSFSGGAFSGRASSQVEQYESRPLLDFSPAANSVRWRTAKDYKTQPAVADGVVYAASNDPKSFDAIDEETGQVLWSWVPGTADTEFHRNVVVTRNLAFVSTNRALYAIDLATHRPVWSSPTPGMVAVSGSGIMYVVVGGRESTGQLLAFKLH